VTENHTNSRPTIGFLIDDLSSGYQSAVWQGMVSSAQEQDVNLLCVVGGVLRSSFEFVIQRNVLYDLVGAENVDGLVILSGAMGSVIASEEFGKFCERYRPLPMVSIALAMEGIPSILLDNYHSMREAIVHLVEVHGYRRIAFYRKHEGHPEADERYRAYVDVLTEHDLPLDPNLVVPGDYYDVPKDGIRLLFDERKLQPQADLDALVAVDDYVALPALEELQARGIQVPDDVAVVGFDDVEDSRFVAPPLTTVRQPLREQGRLALEMVLAQLRGEEVPQQTMLQAKLVARQSCGCLSQAAVQAAVGPVIMTGDSLETGFVARREEVLAEMTRAIEASSPDIDPEWVGQVLDGFVAELVDGSTGVLSSTLGMVLRHVVIAGGDVAAWQEVMSVLRRYALPYLGDDEVRSRAEDLWQQGRVIIGEMAQLTQARKRLQEAQRSGIVHEIGLLMIATLRLEELTDLIVQQLPRVGVSGCYVSLYEGKEMPPEQSRLILAYNGRERVELEVGGVRYPSRQLVPEGLLPQQRRHTLVVESLHFGENQLGFVLLEAGPEEVSLYDTLRGQLSSALQEVLLVEEVENRRRELQEANYALQRRAIQIEASAEVGRVITSIFDIDELLQQTATLISDRFDFYHTGIFLLDEMREWAILEEATGEAGAQMKAEGHRLAVGDSSMVGWTAAHNQARIASDVGEDAVRFAHPLLPDTRSEMTLPLSVGDRVLGVLNVQSMEEAAFDQDDVRALQAMANQVAVAIENAQRVSDEAALLEATSPIYRTSRFLTTATTTTEVADAIIASVGETGADGCIVVRFEFSPAGEPEALLYLGVWRRDREPQFQPGLRLPIAESPFPLEMVSTLWAVPDVDEDDRLPRSARVVFQATGAKALVNIPLHSGERVMGQVVVIRSTPGPFPESALRLYEVLSDQAAVALERAELLEQAQQRAEREQQSREMIDHIRRAVDLDQALGAAAEELSRAMGVPHVSIELGLAGQKE
jgi:DNA-binding LacI/PurR family transcriptional regulator/GAF domain-containing protein